MAYYLPIGPLKTRSGMEPYRDANPVPSTPLTDDIATAPSGLVKRPPFNHVYTILYTSELVLKAVFRAMGVFFTDSIMLGCP